MECDNFRNVIAHSLPYTLASYTECQHTNQNLPKSMAVTTRRKKNSQHTTANHGSQPVSGHLEK